MMLIFVADLFATSKECTQCQTENLLMPFSSLVFPLQAPFTPFITELMYQNLRHLIDPASVEEKDSGSIHYLMLPQVRLGKSLDVKNVFP